MPRQKKIPPEPKPNCSLCPRLVAFRRANQKTYPDYFNGAVASFGDESASILVVGLAPGLKGANKTGRPFTGDFSGELLFNCLTKMGWSNGQNENHPDDGFELQGVMITNAVRCVPPENKPVGQEVNNCRPFLMARIDALPSLKVLFALGKVAHDTTLRNFGFRLADFPFAHKAEHHLPNGLILVDSYHCSRYNVNTGRLTEAMFMDALETAKKALQP